MGMRGAAARRHCPGAPARRWKNLIESTTPATGATGNPARDQGPDTTPISTMPEPNYRVGQRLCRTTPVMSFNGTTRSSICHRPGDTTAAVRRSLSR